MAEYLRPSISTITQPHSQKFHVYNLADYPKKKNIKRRSRTQKFIKKTLFLRIKA